MASRFGGPGVDGTAMLATALCEAGVDGVLVVDYPPEESEAFATALRNAGIACIYLLAPTSSDARIEAAARVASGYLYYVSLKGTTGAASLDVASVAAKMPLIPAMTSPAASPLAMVHAMPRRRLPRSTSRRRPPGDTSSRPSWFITP